MNRNILKLLGIAAVLSIARQASAVLVDPAPLAGDGSGFAKWDANGDGVIDKQEFKKMRKKMKGERKAERRSGKKANRRRMRSNRSDAGPRGPRADVDRARPPQVDREARRGKAPRAGAMMNRRGGHRGMRRPMGPPLFRPHEKMRGNHGFQAPRGRPPMLGCCPQCPCHGDAPRSEGFERGRGRFPEFMGDGPPPPMRERGRRMRRPMPHRGHGHGKMMGRDPADGPGDHPVRSGMRDSDGMGAGDHPHPRHMDGPGFLDDDGDHPGPMDGAEEGPHRPRGERPHQGRRRGGERRGRRGVGTI